MNLPREWPHDRKPVGFDWTYRARADRIIERFAEQHRHGVAEARALQTDERSLPAARICALLSHLAAPTPDARAALSLLRGFDGRVAGDSAAAALFEVWWTKHLKPAVFRRAARDPGTAALLAPGDADAIVGALENPQPLLGSAAERDAIMVETLGEAMKACAVLMGDDPAAWAWGRLHHGYFPHPLASLAGGALRDVGPLPMGGSGSTVKLASYRAADFRVMHGASFRMIVDLADLDGSLCVNAPGQSGDPRSVHYDRLAPVWAASDYAPLLYTRDAVDKATEFVWRLTPA
jgi:penicillin amidase